MLDELIRDVVVAQINKVLNDMDINQRLADILADALTKELDKEGSRINKALMESVTAAVDVAMQGIDMDEAVGEALKDMSFSVSVD